MMFGMTEKHFNSLSPEEKHQVIEAYNEQKRIEKMNEPMMSIIGVGGNLLDKKMPTYNSSSNTREPISSSTRISDMQNYQFKPEECHYENGTKICHHSSEEHSFWIKPYLNFNH
ncbi:MAG: hypothetical protein LEGION0398_MBIBDBAK_00626 [Legionellaceae bacterium]